MTMHTNADSNKLLFCYQQNNSFMNLIQEIDNDLTIGKIVAINYRTAEVFKKYGIDFCCKGNRLLSDVCTEKNLNYEAVLDEAMSKLTENEQIGAEQYKEMPIDELALHIERRHHTYVRESIPILMAYLNKINKVHGERHPELNELYIQFENCANELTHHMVKEETILFPAIKQLASAIRDDAAVVKPFFFGTLNNPINMMKHEHSTEGDRFARMAEITNNFTPPEDGCTTYRVAFQKLQEFQNDLFLHIHLENNILFPQALEMEEKIRR